MCATIKDVAKLAEVSTATVSNVLTKKKFVSSELVERVNEAMNTLDYKPNVIARSLKINRSFNIGLMVPDITNPFFSEIVKHIQCIAYKENYQITLCNSDNDELREKKIIDSFLSSSMDGIINIAPRAKNNEINTSFSIPMIIVDRPHFETKENIAFVYSDNFNGGEQVAKHFISHNYKEFACFAGPVLSVPNARKRLDGFMSQLAKCGISSEKCVVYYCDYSFESGYDTMNKLLENYHPNEPPKAVFATSDIMAWGAMEAAKTRNLKIPRDISVVGYDNIFFSNFLYPQLTTVENPTQELGTTAIKLLLESINNEKKLNGKVIMLDSTLIERQSS